MPLTSLSLELFVPIITNPEGIENQRKIFTSNEGENRFIVAEYDHP